MKPSLDKGLEQHRHIYEKICERDSEGAGAALHHHLGMALQLAKKSGLIKEQPLNAG